MSNEQQAKTKAELYREERKQRLAEANKKAGKGKTSVGNNRDPKRTDKVVTLVVVIALALVGVMAMVNFLGIPQRMTTMMKVGEAKVSKAEYTYYYRENLMEQYNYAQQMAQMAQMYGMGTMEGMYDASKLPSDQEYTGEEMPKKEDGSKSTWQDFFIYASEKRLTEVKMYYAKSQEEKIELTEEEIKEIDNQIEEMRTQLKEVETDAEGKATSAPRSVNVYLRNTYGSGINEKLLVQIMKERKLASKYLEEKTKALSNNIAKEELEKYYTEHQAEFAIVGANYFTFAFAEDDANGEKALKQANEMLSKVTTADAFAELARTYTTEEQKEIYKDDAASQLKNVTQATLTSSLGEEAAKWVFDAARKAGDKKVFKTDSAAIVVLLNETAHKDERSTVNVRHILLRYGEATDDKAKKEVYDKAKGIYDGWLKGDKKEESFAALATEKTEDTGSKEKAGLYENVKPGDMVKAFDAWIFDSNRKHGDTGLVETEYGVHIMYFVSNNEDPAWMAPVREAAAAGSQEKFAEELKASDAFKVEKNDKKIEKYAKKISRLSL